MCNDKKCFLCQQQKEWTQLGPRSLEVRWQELLTILKLESTV